MSCKGWENCTPLSDPKIGSNPYTDPKTTKATIDDTREGMIASDSMSSR
ncbi:hypothetical protein CUAC110533_12015 [Cutibacterium acnes subsp. elongatum]